MMQGMQGMQGMQEPGIEEAAMGMLGGAGMPADMPMEGGMPGGDPIMDAGMGLMQASDIVAQLMQGGQMDDMSRQLIMQLGAIIDQVGTTLVGGGGPPMPDEAMMGGGMGMPPDMMPPGGGGGMGMPPM